MGANASTPELPPVTFDANGKQLGRSAPIFTPSSTGISSPCGLSLVLKYAPQKRPLGLFCGSTSTSTSAPQCSRMLHECGWIDTVMQLFQGPADDPARFNHLRLHFADDQASSRWVEDLTALATAAGTRARRSAARKRHIRPDFARTGTLLLAPATWLEHDFLPPVLLPLWRAGKDADESLWEADARIPRRYGMSAWCRTGNPTAQTSLMRTR